MKNNLVLASLTAFLATGCLGAMNESAGPIATDRGRELRKQLDHDRGFNLFADVVFTTVFAPVAVPLAAVFTHQHHRKLHLIERYGARAVCSTGVAFRSNHDGVISYFATPSPVEDGAFHICNGGYWLTDEDEIAKRAEAIAKSDAAYAAAALREEHIRQRKAAYAVLEKHLAFLHTVPTEDLEQWPRWATQRVALLVKRAKEDKALLDHAGREDANTRSQVVARNATRDRFIAPFRTMKNARYTLEALKRGEWSLTENDTAEEDHARMMEEAAVALERLGKPDNAQDVRTLAATQKKRYLAWKRSRAGKRMIAKRTAAYEADAFERRCRELWGITMHSSLTTEYNYRVWKRASREYYLVCANRPLR